jgi:hypothetical protein
MANENLGLNVNTQNQDSSTVSTSQSSAPAESAPVTSSPAPAEKQERLFTREELGKIANTESKKAYDKARKDAFDEMQKTSVPPEGYVRREEAEKIARQIAQQEIATQAPIQAEKLAQQKAALDLASQFINKLESAKEKYPDFTETVSRLNLGQMADTPIGVQLISLTNSLENTADVMYELGRSPAKYAQLAVLMHTAPEMAKVELQQLSQSIKQNEAAKGYPTASQPLNHPKPSATATDSGSTSIRDLRRQKYLR